MNRLLTATNIPFHGEPAIGMQVMGVLETRNLDFRNLIMLSLNEGQLPKAGGDSSFIPYNLRKAFGMTTIEHKNSVYAYYFYRLIQRAENITLLYNTASDGLNRGEMSRFMLQFLVESPHDISRQYLEAGQSPQQSLEIEIHKTDEVLQRMYNAYDIRRHPNALFSPSALNTYLDCRLRFYYRYVAGLKAPDEVSAEIDSALFGTIFHRSAELVYQDLTANGKEIRREDLEQLLRNDVRLQAYVDTAFKEEFFHVPAGEQPEYNGTQLIHSKVIASYLRQLLRNDLQYAPFRMEGMEQKVTETLEIDTPSGILPLNIGGTDRPYGQQRRYPAHRGLQDGWHSQDSRKHRAVVYPCRQPSELHLPDFPVCCHYVPQARTEGSSIPAVHPPCGIRELLARYRDGRTAPAQSTGQQFCVL